MVTDDQVAAGLDARAFVSREHLYLYATERCRCGADYTDSHVMRETLEFIERATEQPEYEWGTRWHSPARPPHPARDTEYPAPNRDFAEQDLASAVIGNRQAVLIRRQVAGPWEEVK